MRRANCGLGLSVIVPSIALDQRTQVLAMSGQIGDDVVMGLVYGGRRAAGQHPGSIQKPFPFTAMIESKPFGGKGAPLLGTLV